MVLVDTAVWIDHLHVGVPELVGLLERARVCTHPMVIGELALGNLRRRDEVITLLSDLSGTTAATHDEVLQLIDSQQLSGKGLSLVDVHLLAATLLTPTRCSGPVTSACVPPPSPTPGIRHPSNSPQSHVTDER